MNDTQPVLPAGFAPPDPRVLGQRLQDARKAAGLTQQGAADELGYARTTLVAIEKGERRVSEAEVIAFAALYRRAVSELVGQRPVTQGFVPQFRATSMSGTSELEASAVELQRRAEDYAHLEALSGVAPVRSYPPVYETAGSPPEQAAEDVATAERNRLGLGDGPVASLRERLESDVGLRIFGFEMPSKVAGLFAYNDSLGACIALNARHPRERQRWTLAHEYGHFLMTRYQPDVAVLAQHLRPSSADRLADAFARHFLMPAAGLNRRFAERQRASPQGVRVADLVMLADLYQVSVQAMVLRLEELRRVAGGTWDRLKSRGFQPREAQRLLGLPAETSPHETLPDRYVDLAASAYRRGELSEGQFARLLRTDRVTAREVAEAASARWAEQAGDFAALELDLAEAVSR